MMEAESGISTNDGPLVVIPCLNEAAHIQSVLATVLRDPTAASGLIVVVDGGSTDDTPGIVRGMAEEHPGVRLLDNPKRIQGAGINLAVRTFGKGRKWLVRLDAHSQYPEGYVGQLVDVAKATGAGSVVVSMHTLARTCFQKAAAVAQNSRLGTGGSAHRIGAASGPVDHGHHALMDLPLFVAVGGYDEQMATNEDAELDFRLTAKGTLIWLSAENSIGYFPRATPVRLMTQYFRFGAGRADTVTRHRIRPKVRQLAMIFLGPAVLGAVMTPVLTVAAIPLAAWTGISLSYGAWIAVQARSVCAIGAGPAAMIMHMSWSMGFWWFLITRGAARMRAAPTPASALGGPGC